MAISYYEVKKLTQTFVRKVINYSESDDLSVSLDAFGESNLAPINLAFDFENGLTVALKSSLLDQLLHGVFSDSTIQVFLQSVNNFTTFAFIDIGVRSPTPEHQSIYWCVRGFAKHMDSNTILQQGKFTGNVAVYILITLSIHCSFNLQCRVNRGEWL